MGDTSEVVNSNRLRVLRSRRFMIPFIGAVILAMVVIGVATLAVGKAHHFATNFLGPPLSSQARDEIAHADCKRLIELDRQYSAGGDSEEPAITGLRLTSKRVAELRCPLPPDLRPATG